MKVRGQRECQDCGTRWSYYHTGAVACPDCGSLRSVGVGDRDRHTDGPARLDLSAHRERMSAGRFDRDARGALTSDLRAYLRQRGFISGGELRPLDDTYLAARELLTVAEAYGRRRDPDEDARLYLLELIGGADAGERPPPGDVPASMAAARGLAVATAVGAYRRELTTHLDDRDRAEPDARTALGRLRDRIRRVEALDGYVDPADAERLVRAARDVGAYLRTGDAAALARASDRLDEPVA